METGKLIIGFSFTNEFGDGYSSEERVDPELVEIDHSNQIHYLTEAFKRFLIAATFNENVVNNISYVE